MIHRNRRLKAGAVQRKKNLDNFKCRPPKVLLNIVVSRLGINHLSFLCPMRFFQYGLITRPKLPTLIYRSISTKSRLGKPISVAPMVDITTPVRSNKEITTMRGTLT